MSALSFDKYEIIRRLAVGGMGEIFLARQTGVAGFERLAIIKTLLPDLAGDPSQVQQFLDEARVAATLNHPNIVGVYEVGQWEGTYFLAMEFVRGATVRTVLRELAASQQTTPPAVAAHIIRDAAQGLAHAHAATDTTGAPLHIVHRDVTSSNLMIREDGVTKVLDFGIARASNRESRTNTGMVKGTVAYMSPEQLLGEALDHRSDQFSLGVVFWEVLTSQRLFDSSSPAIFYQQLMEREMPDPMTLRPDTPPELAQIVMRMLSRDREQRFDDCKQVARQLKDYLDRAASEIDADRVGRFVQSVAGARIREATADLTPQHGSSLLGLAAHGATGAATTPISGTRPPTAAPAVASPHAPPTAPAPSTPPTAARGRFLAVAALVGVVGMAGGMGGLVLAERWRGGADESPAGHDEPQASEKAEAAAPPTAPASPARAGPPVAGDIAQPPPAEPPQRTPRRSTKRARKSVPPPTTSPGPAPAPAQAVGYLTLVTVPWTSVSIDGQHRGPTPLFKLELSAGRHRVRMVNEEEGVDTTRDVVIEPGKDERLRLTLQP